MESGRRHAQQRQRATLGNARSRDTRTTLIRAALRLWSEGDFVEAYEKCTAADIARAAGVSKGTFYFHFANKEAILAEMGSATVQMVADAVDAGIEQGVPLRPLSEQVMALMARRVARTPKAAALRVGALGFAGRTGGPVPAGPRLSGAFESLVRYGKQCGEIAAGVDEEDTAAMLTAVTAEAVARWGRDDRSAAWLRRTLRERVAIVLRGVAYRED